MSPYSRSSTVVKILKACKDKEIKIICSESRPRYEGRKLAKELRNHFEVILTTDAAIFSFIDEADIVLTGADAILKEHVINKVGTAAITLCANEKKKPFYVAASSYKVFPFIFIKEERKEEIWRKAPKEIKIRNFYFDATPCEHINSFITENGISKGKPSFKFKIADEINRIKELLSRKYHLLK